MMFSLNTVDYSMSFLSLSTSFFLLDHNETFLLLEFFLWYPSFMIKSYWVVVLGGWVVVAYRILVSV